MRMERFIPIIWLVAIAAASAVAQDADQIVVEEVIARVNGDIVTVSQFDKLFGPMQNEISIRFSGERLQEELRNARRYSLNLIINQTVVKQQAREKGITFPDDVFNRQVESIKQRIGAQSDEDFIRALADQGMTMEEFRSQFEYQYYIEVLFGNDVGRDLYQSESRLQNFYEENIDQYTETAKIRLSQLVLPFSLADEETAKAAAEQALSRLEAGEDFGEVYRSLTPGAAEDAVGDIGQVDLQSFRRDLAEEVGPLAAGEHTGIIRTDAAFLILQVTERQESETIPLEKIKDRVMEDMRIDTYTREVGKYITQLKKNSLINIIADRFEGLYEETFFEGQRGRN
ncbi:MAG TPA: peptidyl-prolyl cis-trans isomerase [Acidobacteriota bacterium]|nr:peptidyl-prolyl cis-trans isomerase [Acidobacteriota bacterium]